MRRVLLVRNTTGSVEHYYHFFFAVLVPLLDRIREGSVEGGSVIRSCGPMDRHLAALTQAGLVELKLLHRQHWPELLGKVPPQFIELLHSEECYDAHGVRPDGYRRFVLKRVREFAVQTFATDAAPGDVLLIERGNPHPFYLSQQAEIRGSARLRRSVPNTDALVDALQAEGRQVTRMRLETTGLAEQIAAFARHRLVLAQHGAALSNVMWMAPGSRVVEILPLQQGRREHFSRLAAIAGASYAAVDQDHNHAPVDVDRVLAAAHVLRVAEGAA